MSKDWIEWHGHYDKPNSPLAHRLTLVHEDLRRALREAPRDHDGVVQLLSICAGEGRDVLPVLAERGDDSVEVRALLVELDELVARSAETAVARLGLAGVEVRAADAGSTTTYFDVPPAHVLLACGVFGNISASDMRRTVATLPTLLASGGIVIWTRAARRAEPGLAIRKCFVENGFAEMSFATTADDAFHIGMHRLADRPKDVRPLVPASRLFSFE